MNMARTVRGLEPRARGGNAGETVESGRQLGRTARRVVSAALVLGMAATVGCSGGGNENVAHWSGAVTIGGQPLPDGAVGTITFRPTAGDTAPAASVPIENGRYDSPNTPKGSVVAYFDITAPTGRTYHSERVGKDIPEMKSIVPPEKNQGMTLTVDEDKSDANLDL